MCCALRGTLSQREKVTGRAFDRQIGSTKRGDRYADCRIRTGFAFDRPICYATGDSERSFGESQLKIVHHSPASPRRPEGNCYHHTKRPGRSDNKLDFYVGRDGIPKLLSFLDLGPYHDPEGQHIPLVSDIREFAELMRFEPPDVVTDNSGME